MHKTIIDANKKRLLPDFKELYQYRDLFLTLTWRDFRVRYAQTTIGFFMGYFATCSCSFDFITGLLYFRKVEDEMANYV